MYTDTMIGTQSLADVIATAHIVEDEDGWPVLAASFIPEGFSWLGSGSERHAFIGPDGVVYKITTSDPHSKYSNSQEWQNFCDLARRLPPGVRFAQCYLWFSEDVDVLAMEYVAGVGEDGAAFSNETLTALQRQGWNDLHEFNMVMVDDTLVLIDFAR